MSYASERLARGSDMWTDSLQGLRERRGRRWVLLLPVALGGMFAMFVVATLNLAIGSVLLLLAMVVSRLLVE